jgi:hypothetical protein
MGATPASQWQGKVAVEGQELPLPSGNVALVQHLSPVAFLASGFMPDPLTNIVRKAINTKQGLPPNTLEKMTQDPEQLGAALETFDRVLTACVVVPEISMPPGCAVEIDGEPCGQMISADVHKNTMKSGNHAFRPGKRDPEVLYADQVDMDDKIFVFQWALGGTSDLAQFREEQREALESVPDSKDVVRPAKRAARARKSV